jgi:hydrogenase/urease accessory protein HupE
LPATDPSPRPSPSPRFAGRGRKKGAASLIVLIGTITSVAHPAHAHDPFEVTTDAHITTSDLRLHTTLSLLTAGRICLPADGGRRVLRASEFPAARGALEACARDFYRLTDAGAALLPTAVTLVPTVEEDLDVKVTYPRPGRGPLGFDAAFLRHISQPSAGVLLTVTGERAFLGQQVLRAEAPTFEAPLEPDAPAPGAPPAAAPSFRQFLALGVRHIMTGYDHLLFLLGLLVACRTRRAVLGVVTCFTAAHSITLALAALDLVALPSRVVEPLIAATIIVIGVENLYHARTATGDQPPRGRYLLTFAFGLLHGFGFAAVLREVGLGSKGAPILLPLFGFNLGVELGQIAVAAVALPVLWQLRRIPLFARYGSNALSLAIAGLGVVWLLQRIT